MTSVLPDRCHQQKGSLSTSSSLGINDLPSETLQGVFCLWREFIWGDQSDSWWTTEPQISTPLVFVCKHWHAVALHCPRLWSRIHLHSVGAAKTYLARSGNVPLAVRAQAQSTTDTCFTALILALRELPRIQSLDLRYGYQLLHCNIIYWTLYGARAPRLLSMRITYLPSSTAMPDFVPLPFCWGNAPVQHLTYHTFRMESIVKSLVPSITQLTLRDPVLRWSSLDLTDLCRALRSLPLLNLLCLANLEEKCYALRSISTSETVCLPALRLLQLLANPQECRAVIRAIEFPCMTSVHVTHYRAMEEERSSDIHDEEDLTMSFEHLDELVDAYRSNIIRAADLEKPRVVTLSLRTRYHPGPRVDEQSRLRLIMETWAHELGHTPGDFKGHEPSFQVSTRLSDADILLRRVCGGLPPLACIRALFIGAIPNISRRCWATVLRPLRGLRTLCVVGAAADELPEALGARYPAGLLCPALERLVLREILWQAYPLPGTCELCADAAAAGVPAACDAALAHAFLPRLRACLAARRALGAGLPKLYVVKGVNFGERERAVLERVVETLYWDGVLDTRVPDDDPWSSESDEDERWSSDCSRSDSSQSRLGGDSNSDSGISDSEESERGSRDGEGDSDHGDGEEN